MSIRSKIKQLLKTKYQHFYELQKIKIDLIRRQRQQRKRLKSDSRYKKTPEDQDFLNESKQFLMKHFSGFKNTDWHLFYYKINKIAKPEYIPEALYFPIIEPHLNKTKLSPAYCDKLSYDLYFKKTDMPKTIFKLLDGYIFDDENNLVNETKALQKIASTPGSLVLKPAILSGGGRNVIIDTAANIASLLNNNKSYKSGSYILQEKVVQHELMAKFNPKSVNTCRLMTAKVDSEIVVLGAYMRIGRGNSQIDNASYNGLYCNIEQDGTISNFALDKYVNYYSEHPESGIKFSGFSIPNYDQVVDFCVSNHQRFLRFTLISWDIAIKKDGSPVFIEFNLSRQSIVGQQIMYGPLFGKHTMYFINRYKEEKSKDPYYF